MYLRPAPDIKIRDPDLLDFLPDEGREVPDNDFWHRRLRDGDAISGTATVAENERSQE